VRVGSFGVFKKKAGSKNAIPPCGRKRIFAEFETSIILKHFLVVAFDV